MSQYRDVAQAVVRAFNCGEGKPKSASWQDQYIAGYKESRLHDCDYMSAADRITGDAMTHAIIKNAIPEVQYKVLMLKYSGNAKEQIESLEYLAPFVGTNAGPNFRRWVIGHWALEVIKKASPTPINLDMQDVTARTLAEWKLRIRSQLKGWHENAFDHLEHIFKDGGLI